MKIDDDGEIEIISNNGKLLTLRADGSRFSLHCLPKEDYPIIDYENTGIKDRGFMDSLYFREPLGLLIEIASYKFDPPFGYSHGQVLEKAHQIRINRGAKNIEDIDVASAIKSLVWKN